MSKQLLILIKIIAIVNCVEFQVENKDGGDVWIGVKGYDGKAHLNNGGFVLGANSKISIQAPNDWGGHFWARTWCNTANNHCQTGDCGNKIACASAGWTPPATVADFNLQSNGMDYYDISLVDGFNAIVKIEPINGNGECRTMECTSHIDADCPDDLKLTNDNGVIGCKSACAAFNTDQYCCRNDYANKEKCNPDNWPTNYAAYFKEKCPNAWTYGFDDDGTVGSCIADSYHITFGG